MQFRNYLYDIGNKPAFEFTNLVISVGNLSVGGTGKTPFVEYLIRFFLKKHSNLGLSTLSRGYGRKSKGFILAGKQATASQIGDEPYQIYRKFGADINVAVCEDRVLAVPSILLERPDNQVILLDDAYQHRSVKPNFSVMLSDYHRPFFTDYVLPSGLLREGRSGANRADVIIITKCPGNISVAERQEMAHKIKSYAPQAFIFFTKIAYAPIHSSLNRSIKKKLILLTGIANTITLEEHLAIDFSVVQHVKYADHHLFTVKELAEVVHMAMTHEADILTTEKDWVRIISDPLLLNEVEQLLFYQPMMVQFLDREDEFLSLLEAKVTAVINS
jgi:tetraacyldisaccharide 4'-kinase